MDTKIRFTVDATHCEAAQTELAAMLLRQARDFSERWYGRKSVLLAVRVLQIVGIALSLFGLALIIGVLVLDAHARTPQSLFFVAAFVAFSAIFIFLSRIKLLIRAWIARRAVTRSNQRARKMCRAARQLAPFEADYDIKGDLLSYARGKDGQWRFAWHRKLAIFRERGLAIRAAHITAIFRRATSFMPAIIVLHSDGAWLRTALDEIGVRSIDIDGEFPEPLGQVGLDGVATK